MSTLHSATSWIIKKEYIVNRPEITIEQTTGKTNNNDVVEPPKKKQKTKRRGQNKSRNKKNKIRYDIDLCPDLGHGRECKFGDRCKFSHDVQKYLTVHKPKDIGNRCIFFEALGHCPAGYMCRFAHAHIDDEGKLINNNNKTNNDNHNKNIKTEIEQKIDDNNNQDVDVDIDVNNNQQSKTNGSIDEQKQKFIRNFGEQKQEKYEIIPELNLVRLKDVKLLSKTKENNFKPFPITKQLLKYYKQFDNFYHPAKRRKIISQQIYNNDNDINEIKQFDKIQIIQQSNDYKLNNVFSFKDRTQNDANLIKKQQQNNGDTVPNYYSSLNLIYLEKRPFDIKNKLYLAPLTTVGNLPFRRICVEYGAEITCSEMALSTRLIRGMRGEWALCRRHESEKCFGLQIAGGFVNTLTKVTEFMHHKLNQFDYDFIDLNVGCPLDEICNRRSGAGLMKVPYHLRTLLRSLHSMTDKNHYRNAVPITCKMRMGFMHKTPNAKQIINILSEDGVSAIGIHGRSRQQRYRRPANWDYIRECVEMANKRVDIIGNGDIYNFNEWYERLEKSKCSTIMIGRGALIKPWIFQEIKEKKHLDVSSTERLNIIKKFTNYGLERWGSDQRGVDLTRRFLLEWLSFLNRYIPYGILERTVKINECPPNTTYFVCRNELETLMASKNVNDWIKITEMFLGPVNDSKFTFIPKHKASSYAPSIVDNKNYTLNELGEVIKLETTSSNDKNIENKSVVLTTNLLGKKRKLDDI